MRTSVLLFIALISLEWAQSQVVFPDTTFDQNYTVARREYDLSRNQQAAIYNGIQHVGYGSSLKGSAYFLTPEWSTGSVLYDGMLYKNIPLRYDLVAGDLVVQSPNGFGINLYSPRVKYFTIEGHRFINISSQDADLSPGFYDVLIQGPMTILVKRHKKVVENIVGLEAEHEILQDDNFYLLIDGRIHSIRNEDDMLKYTGEKRKEIKKSIKRNHIHFKKEMESAVKLIAGTYNQSK